MRYNRRRPTNNNSGVLPMFEASLFETSLFETSSSYVVTATLLLLIALSVVCWTIIPVKVLQYLHASVRNRAFTQAFWNTAGVDAARALTLYGPAARVAQAGFAALDAPPDALRLGDHGDRRERVERALRHQLQRERKVMETGLPWLASIGTTAPFVGLFGTVWGIRHALKDISTAGAAGLDVVAGPIGEALIATAIGIAVAVPAVIGYNILLRRLRNTGAALDDFATDFMTIALRSEPLSQRG